MSWVAQTTYKGLTIATINGQGSGTDGIGMTGTWAVSDTGTVNDYSIVSTPTFSGSDRSLNLQNTSGGTGTCSITLSADPGSGVLYALIRSADVSVSAGIEFYLYNGSSTCFYLRFRQGSLIALNSSTTFATGLSNNTWYEVECTFNQTTKVEAWRWRIQGGTWSSSTGNLATGAGSTTGYTSLHTDFGGATTALCYMGYISPTMGGPVSAVNSGFLAFM